MALPTNIYAEVSTYFPGQVTAGAGITATKSGNVWTITADMTSIALNSVEFDKIQQISTARLLGRVSTATGNVEQLTVGGGIEFSTSGIQRSALTGDVTATSGGSVTIISNDAVTTDKILDANVTEDKIATGAVTTDKLGVASVTSTSIANNAVTTDKLGVGSVTSTSIADNAVTTDKLGVGSVTSTSIANNAVTLEKLATQVDASILANVSGTSSVPSAQTFTAVLDYMAGSTRGSVLYRGASAWTNIAPGTSTYVLTSNGAGDDPSYQAVPTAATGSIVQTVSAEYTANTTLSTVTPFDDTIPQITEGTQILFTNITPTSTSNVVRIEFVGTVSSATAGAGVTAAVFITGTADAIASDVQIIPGAGYMNKFVVKVDHSPASTSTLTYTVRVGPQSPFTCALNGQVGTRYGGGSQRAVMCVQEIKG